MAAGRRIPTGRWATAGIGLVWVAGLFRILQHRLFISHDTLINYAHVWYVSDRLWHRHGFPLHMPSLSHGRALAFPYAFVPWTAAAILRPLAGDWIVTLWLVVGAVLVIAATFWAFPELRGGWWAAAVLLNPALVVAPLIGQLPFLWGSAFLLAAVGCWRRDRRWAATAFVALAQATHPAVVAPIAAAVVVGRWLWEPDRRALARHYALSLLPAVPAVVMVWRSPVFTESSTWVKTVEFVETVAPRSFIVAVPVALALAARRRPRDTTAIGACAVLLVGIAVFWGPQGLPSSWRGLSRNASPAMLPFLASARFEPGRTYRLLRIGDGKVGLYQLLRAGGRSDAEFFPESVLSRSFGSPEAYSRVLRSRRVDSVMLWKSYVRASGTDEAALLASMAGHPPPTCDGPTVCVDLVGRTAQYTLYRIGRSGPRQALSAPST